MTDLTIFTAPKPFTDPHIALIQRNAILSWKNLGPRVEIILLGDEAGLAEFAAEHAMRHIREVACSPSGTPLVSSMFALARQHSRSPLLACVNADILLMPDFVDGALAAHRQARQFLLVGQRYDLDVREPLEFGADWPAHLRRVALEQGRLHRASGSDYFVFPRDCFVNMPAFAIGRAGWDNWMIYAGRRSGWPVIDGTPSIMIVHQNHDYRHLPGGQPHYRHPETYENVRLAGGKCAIFELRDVNRRLVNRTLAAVPASWARFWREVEIFPLVKLKSYALAQLSYAIFHPRKAYREWRAGLRGEQ